MQPEEFTRQLRERTQRALPESVQFARGAVADNNVLIEAKLEQFMSDPGDALARAGLIHKQKVSRTNAVILAMYKSVPLYEYMKRVTEALRQDKEFTAAMQRLGDGIDVTRQPELQGAIKRVIEDDRLLTGPLKIMHEDPAIRDALGLPDEITFESYIQDVRRAIRDAESFERILDAASCGPKGDPSPAFCTATVCFGVVSIVTLLAVVQTVIGAVSYLFVYAVAANAVVAKWTVAVTVEGSASVVRGSDLPVSDADLESNCVNESAITVWVVVRFDHALKRVPLPPGKSTAGMGLPVIECVLIGGKHNALTALQTSRDGLRTFGAYVLHKDRGTPGVITIRSGVRACEAVANASQAEAETSGRAGYSDLVGTGSAGANFDLRYRMTDTAAAVPEGFDLVTMINESVDAEHFYRTLRMASVARSLTGDQTHG